MLLLLCDDGPIGALALASADVTAARADVTADSIGEELEAGDALDDAIDEAGDGDCRDLFVATVC